MDGEMAGGAVPDALPSHEEVMLDRLAAYEKWKQSLPQTAEQQLHDIFLDVLESYQAMRLGNRVPLTPLMLSGMQDCLYKITMMGRTKKGKRGRPNYLYDVQRWFYRMAALPVEIRCV